MRRRCKDRAPYTWVTSLQMLPRPIALRAAAGHLADRGRTTAPNNGHRTIPDDTPPHLRLVTAANFIEGFRPFPRITQGYLRSFFRCVRKSAPGLGGRS